MQVYTLLFEEKKEVKKKGEKKNDGKSINLTREREMISYLLQHG